MATDFSFLPAFVEITPELLTSAQPSPDDFARLAEMGVGAVINLATPASSNYNPDEAQIVRRLGMRYAPIPVDWEAPGYNKFLLFLLAVRSHHDLARRKILVHCAMNMRVSAFVYLLQTGFRGEDEGTARARMEQIWTPNETWQTFIDDVSEHLTTHPRELYEAFGS